MLLIFGSVKSHTHTVENMIFLILAVILVIILTIGLFHYDQARWRKYKIYREMYFHKNPYFVSCNQTFAVSLIVPRYNYDRLMNNLMLLDTTEGHITQAYLEKGVEREGDVKVLINHVLLGYLEKNYAQRFCQALEHTDFFVGRPVCVDALINLNFFKNPPSKYYINLDLPENPDQVGDLLKQKSIE